MAVLARSTAGSNPVVRIALSHPSDERGGSRHRRKAALPDKSPVIEQTRILYCCQRRTGSKVTYIFQIHDRGFAVSRVVPRRTQHLRQSYHGGLTAAVVDEDSVSRSHRSQRLDSLGIAHSIPSCLRVPLQVVHRIAIWFGLGKKVVQTWAPRASRFCYVTERHMRPNCICGRMLRSERPVGYQPGPELKWKRFASEAV